jgi:hypothetical protein
MTYDFETYFAKARDAATPWVEMGEYGFDLFEKGFQIQAELLGDAIDMVVDELKILSTASGPVELLQAQAKLAEGYALRAQKRAQELMQAATQSQQTLTGWAEKGFKQAQSGFEEAVSVAQGAVAPKPARKKAA